MGGGGMAVDNQTKLNAGTERVCTPLSIMNCPTRRRPLNYPWPAHTNWFWFQPGGMNPPVNGFARSDYAACGGDLWTYAAWPHAIQNAFIGPAITPSPNDHGYLYIDGPGYHNAQLVAATMAPSPYWPAGVYGPATATGVSFAVSMIRASDVTDGLSSTYLLGEKNIDCDHYTDGNQGGDNEWALAGFDYDTYRFADHDMPGPYAINDPGPSITRLQSRHARPLSRHAGLRVRPGVWQCPRVRREHGAVRRVGPHDRLQHQRHGANTPL